MEIHFSGFRPQAYLREIAASKSDVLTYPGRGSPPGSLVVMMGCCETAILENEAGDHCYALVPRSAPHRLNRQDPVQHGRLAPHPRVGPARATRDRLRYRL